MPKVNPKQLGNILERKISKKLSLFLTDGTQDHAVWKTSGSGMISTLNKNVCDKFEGDLTKVFSDGVYKKLDSFFTKFCVECKYRTDLSFLPPYKQAFIKTIIDDITDKRYSRDVLLVFANKGKSEYYFTKNNYDNQYDLVLNIKERNLILYGYTSETFYNIIGNYL